jgi:hypothetical protein
MAVKQEEVGRTTAWRPMAQYKTIRQEEPADEFEAAKVALADRHDAGDDDL